MGKAPDIIKMRNLLLLGANAGSHRDLGVTIGNRFGNDRRDQHLLVEIDGQNFIDVFGCNLFEKFCSLPAET